MRLEIKQGQQKLELPSVRYGEIKIKFQDGCMVAVERTEKIKTVDKTAD